MTRYNVIPSLSERFAIMFGGMVAEYIANNQSPDDIYILAVRAFHNARLSIGD